MMRLPTFALVLVVSLSLPAFAAAGPIQFQLVQTGFYVEPDSPMLEAALVPLFEGGTFVVDPSTGNATRVGPLVGYDPSRLPPARPIDLQATGAAFWNNSGNFRLDFRMTDGASGATHDFSMWGRAHAHAYTSVGNPWQGGVTYWFGDGGGGAVTLGDTDYVIWGQQQFTAEQPELLVWVGENPPFPWVPEPGTFALAALGFAPFALRRLRRQA